MLNRRLNVPFAFYKEKVPVGPFPSTVKFREVPLMALKTICISSACPRSRVMFDCYQRHLLPGRQQGSVSNIYVEFDIAMSKYHFYASYFCHGSSKNIQCGSIEVSRSKSEVERQEPFDLNFAVCWFYPGQELCKNTVQKWGEERESLALEFADIDFMYTDIHNIKTVCQWRFLQTSFHIAGERYITQP